MKRLLFLLPLLLAGCVTKARYTMDVQRATYLGMILAQERCEEKIVNQYRFLFGDRIEAGKKKPDSRFELTPNHGSPKNLGR
jgi:hypothetical protein